VTASPRSIDGNGIAFLEIHDALAELAYPAGVLMAKRKGRLESEVFLHDMQIRVAYARATDLDQHLSWTGGRLGDVLYLSRTADANKSDGLHGLLLY